VAQSATSLFLVLIARLIFCDVALLHHKKSVWLWDHTFVGW